MVLLIAFLCFFGVGRAASCITGYDARGEVIFFFSFSELHSFFLIMDGWYLQPALSCNLSGAGNSFKNDFFFPSSPFFFQANYGPCPEGQTNSLPASNMESQDEYFGRGQQTSGQQQTSGRAASCVTGYDARGEVISFLFPNCIIHCT